MKLVKKIINKFISFNKPKPSFISKDEQIAFINAAQIGSEIYNWQKSIFHEKISLGQNCNSAWYLKQSNNKKVSYPFDWIFSSSNIVLHSIKDDFKYFLDKKMVLNISPHKAGHSFYHSSMFNHKNPLNSDEEYSYYQRAVERFKNILHSNKSIIFICTVISEPNKRLSWSNGFDREIKKPINQSLENFLDLISFIKEINNNAKFLFINQFTEGNLKIDYKFLSEDIMWIDFTSKGANTGVKYLNLIDDTLIKIVYNGLNKN